MSIAEPGLVVVGGSLAGLRAVEAARRAGWDGSITLVCAEPHLPYDRLPLSKKVLAEGGPGEFRPFRAHPQLAELGVDLVLGEPAERLDIGARRISTADRSISYDKLVLATGSTPIMVPGVRRSERVLSLRTWDDAVQLSARLNVTKRLVVVGGGFIGSEIASVAHDRGIDVTIVEAADAPLVPALGPEVAARLAKLHARHGVELLTGAPVREIEEEGDQVHVRLTDDTRLIADTVVVGIGSRPEVGWLAGSGLPIDNGIVCDATLRASDDVYAAGDVACWPNPLLGGRIDRLEHWTSAAEQGLCAGHNAVAGAPVEFGTVPIFWSDWYAHRIQFIGVRSDEVTFLGDEDRFLALYSTGGRLTGAVGLDSPAVVRLRQQVIDAVDVTTVAADLGVAS